MKLTPTKRYRDNGTRKRPEINEKLKTRNKWELHKQSTKQMVAKTNRKFIRNLSTHKLTEIMALGRGQKSVAIPKFRSKKANSWKIQTNSFAECELNISWEIVFTTTYSPNSETIHVKTALTKHWNGLETGVHWIHCFERKRLSPIDA